jgi:dTDP-4-amino-4,6-dideoxygalactose transaminase
MKNFPYSKQHIDKNDLQSVVDALTSDIITGGSTSLKFEKKISKYTGSKYAVSCSNGTAALHLVSMALDINYKDIVIIPTITFAATANAFKINNAKIILCDVDAQTGLVGPKELEECLKINKHVNPTLLCAVHLNGQLCDVKKISDICMRENIKLIFDASHALSANINGVGSSLNDFADCSTFSFHPVKTITTIEGGMVTTNKKCLYERLLKIRENGIERNKDNFKEPSNAIDKKGNKNPWYYEIQEIGLNYRLNDISCALGISQLKKINTLQKKRSVIYQFYDNFFSNTMNIKPIKKIKNQTHGMHLYPLLINFKKLKITKSELINELKKYNIMTQVHYIPLYYHPEYRETNIKISFKGSEKYYSQCLSIPLFPSMTIKDATYIAKKILTLTK